MYKTLFVIIMLLFTTLIFADENYIKELEAKAGKGDAYSQFELGREYLTGSELKQDYAEALKWLKRAADQKSSDAYFELGNMYANGTGVPANNAEAVKWYLLAGESGHTQAQITLGSIYEFGLYDVPKNLKEAARWLEKISGSYVNNSVLTNLAEIYYKAKEYGRAIELYKKTMEGYEPYVGSAGKLAEIYYNGQGIKPDYEESYYYWYISKKANISMDKKIVFTGKIKTDRMKEIEARADHFIKNYKMNMGRGGE